MRTQEQLNKVLKQMEDDCRIIRELIESSRTHAVKLKNQKQ